MKPTRSEIWSVPKDGPDTLVCKGEKGTVVVALRTLSKTAMERVLDFLDGDDNRAFCRDGDRVDPIPWNLDEGDGYTMHGIHCIPRVAMRRYDACDAEDRLRGAHKIARVRNSIGFCHAAALTSTEETVVADIVMPPIERHESRQPNMDDEDEPPFIPPYFFTSGRDD